MSDDSAYRKILRLIGRGRDSPNNNNNKKPEDKYGSIPEHLRGKTFEFPAVSKSLSKKNTFVVPGRDSSNNNNEELKDEYGSLEKNIRGELERTDEYLIDHGANLFKELVKSTHGKNNFRIFSLKELQKATNNFSTYLILYDFSCPTYRGIIEDRHVAVKISTLYNLENEVVILSLIKHRNVMKLLGCCLETRSLILVHELPPNGTLRQYILYEEPPPVELSWADRLRIATEIADALAYLHSELHITHGGLSYFDAVLLDEFHSAKLGAFEHSEIQNQTESSDVETDIIKRDDVYNFGNILLNLLCIQRDDISKFKECKEKVEILKYVKLNVSEKEMSQIKAYIDLLLRCRSWHKEQYHERMKEALGEYIRISVKEFLREYYERMKEVVEDELRMKEVVRELRRIRSMINPQPTSDGSESDNLSSGAN